MWQDIAIANKSTFYMNKTKIKLKVLCTKLHNLDDINTKKTLFFIRF